MSSNLAPQPAFSAPPPRLLEQVCQAARQCGHPEPTVAAFANWNRRFILEKMGKNGDALGKWLPRRGLRLKCTISTTLDSDPETAIIPSFSPTPPWGT